jgi:hypothetical protein
MTATLTSSTRFPADPLASLSPTQDYHRRVVTGILESYNSNYDVLAELVQNAVDAVEDAMLLGLDGPHFVEVHIDLQKNAIGVLDTGVGLAGDQIIEAFAPMVSFKNDPSILTARGQRLPYRGYKGVGLTFIAYGTDDVVVHSRKENGHLVRARMQYARSWARSERDDAAMVVEDTRRSPLEDSSRGTYIRVHLSQKTRPRSLFHIASEPQVWATILRTRTAIGQILFGGEEPAAFEARLRVTDQDGRVHPVTLNSIFLLPHTVSREPKYRFLDVGEYWSQHGETTEIGAEFRRQDGIYFEWGTARIQRELTTSDAEKYAAELASYAPRLYGFLPYQSSIWSETNELLTGHKQRNYVTPGLIVGVNRQRLADTFEIPATRFETLSRNFLALVHFENAKPDQGRKTVQDEVLLLAQRAADRALQYAAKQRAFLKPAGETPSPGQREVERSHEDWLFNVRLHAKSAPIHLPPLTYQSAPLTEQDVIGLFHQLSALGVFPGIQIFATSQSRTYDCLVRYECHRDRAGLRYYSPERSPLGVSPFILGDNPVFQTRHLTLEFKNNLDGLIDDLSGESAKDFPHIDICACWSSVAESFRGYTLEPITSSNIDERRYPGVTHLLRRDSDNHVVQVIMVAEVIEKVRNGSLPLPSTPATA